MKILVCFENRVRPDSTGIYFAPALRALGHEADHVLPQDIHKVKGGYDLYLKIDDGLQGQPWNPELHPSAYYCIDSHLETDWRLQLVEDGRFDTVHVAQKDGLKLPWKAKTVDWTPLGCDLQRHYQPATAKKYDGVFIGHFHSVFAEKRIEAVDAFFKACPGPIFWGNRTFEEMAQKYAESKIIFNQSLNSDINMRVFEALCSGSALLTDRIPEMAELGLIENVHYFGFSGIDEIPGVVKMILANDDLREKVAAEGRREAIERHTYAHRVQRILEAVKEPCLRG